ncbi:hypothetical protein Daus18300_012243 [Diaporthe australafricana]|uniref:Rhodopsin domain-containing protein n=1 Tax=Diaporthe australafricana TaxID=127596 RepID=A0ABR3W3C1_9PEZI
MAETESEKASAGNEAMTTTIVGAVAIVLAVVSTGLRFYARFRQKAGLWWDDWLALAAVLAAVAAGVLVLAASLVDPDAAWLLSENDPGYAYTPANQLDLELAFVADVLYFTVVGAAKASLLLMYTRIFSVSAPFRVQVWVLGAAVAAFWAASTLATIFNCWPIYWSWLNSLSPADHCINYNIFWLVMGVVEEVLDICILVLPVRQVMKLQLSLQKKVGVASIFLLGGLVIITGIVKAVEGWNPHPGARSPHWDKTEIWSSVHASIGIMCASLPVCWPLIIRGTGLLRLSNFSRLKASDRMRSWWQTHRRGRASRSGFSGSRSKEEEEGKAPWSTEALPQAAAAAPQYYAGPPPAPDPHHIRVDTRIDVEYPPQPQYIWDTSRISGQQQYYGYAPQVGSGDAPQGQVYAVQGADGRLYWAQHNPI